MTQPSGLGLDYSPAIDVGGLVALRILVEKAERQRSRTVVGTLVVFSCVFLLEIEVKVDYSYNDKNR